jgi:hypothetical protein
MPVRLQGHSKARQLAEKLIQPYAVGEKADQRCPHLKLVDAVQQQAGVPRNQAYNAVYRALTFYKMK